MFAVAGMGISRSPVSPAGDYEGPLTIHGWANDDVESSDDEADIVGPGFLYDDDKLSASASMRRSPSAKTHISRQRTSGSKTSRMSGGGKFGGKRRNVGSSKRVNRTFSNNNHMHHTLGHSPRTRNFTKKKTRERNQEMQRSLELQVMSSFPVKADSADTNGVDSNGMDSNGMYDDGHYGNDDDRGGGGTNGVKAHDGLSTPNAHKLEISIGQIDTNHLSVDSVGTPSVHHAVDRIP